MRLRGRAPRAKGLCLCRAGRRVRAGETVVYRDGSGAGHGTGCTLGEAHESALKEAETDATKRALTTFGNLFGLALYDKEQNGGRRRAKGHEPEVSRAAAPELYSATGEVISRHETARAFCSALKAAIIKTTVAADLDPHSPDEIQFLASGVTILI